MATASATPVRYPSGVSTDSKFGPLADLGLPNPLLYHSVWDDFDQELVESGYTKTTTGNGTVALTAGDGGIATFTTNSSTPAAADVASLQLPVAGFTFTAMKKSFFLARFQVADAVNAAFNLGLMATTGTPFAANTDGVFFNKATGSASNLTLVVCATGVTTNYVIPTAYYALTNNTNIDLGWYIDRNQNIFAFVGAQLVGWIPQSGTGAVQATTGVPVLPVVGPVTSVLQATTPQALSTANLNPTLALQSGTASSKTGIADFWLTAKER